MLRALGSKMLCHADALVTLGVGVPCIVWGVIDLADRAVEQVPISKHASLAQHALQHEKDCYIDAFQIHVHAPATAAVSPQATLHTYMRSFWQSSPAMWPERAVLAAGRGLARLTGAAADASEEEAADLHSDALPPVGSTLAHGAWRVVDVSSDAGSAELLASWGEGASMSGLTWLAVKPDAGAAQPGHVLQFGSALWGEGYKPSPQSMAYSLHRAYSKVLLYVAAWQYERQLRQMVQTA